jgi:2-hydroxyglutarate dehydrogenase
MYDYCARNAIPHHKLGKLIVAHADQTQYIESLHRKAQTLAVPPRWNAGAPLLPTRLLNGDEARALEPALSDAVVGALHSPETGIVDSHALMESFERDIADAGGALAYATRVVRVEPSPTDVGWVVQAATGDGEPDALLARTLVNASGLAGPLILNSLLPPDRRLPMYFARGSYASYSGPGVEHVTRLLYPCPASAKSKDAHAFQSLGTHLTLDLQGRVRFGPDLEWLAPPAGQEDDEDAVDFWARHLVPNGERVSAMHAGVTSYLPRVALDGLQPDYAGVRPKLVGPGGGFQDFVLRLDMSEDLGGRQGAPMVSLLGIESPGLTASMAIAEAVVEDVLVAKGSDGRRA